MFVRTLFYCTFTDERTGVSTGWPTNGPCIRNTPRYDAVANSMASVSSSPFSLFGRLNSICVISPQHGAYTARCRHNMVLPHLDAFTARPLHRLGPQLNGASSSQWYHSMMTLQLEAPTLLCQQHGASTALCFDLKISSLSGASTIRHSTQHNAPTQHHASTRHDACT